MLGLERKIDVLRAQLAACRAGLDPGPVGIETWSRLEEQAKRIADLECALHELAGHLCTVLHAEAIVTGRRNEADPAAIAALAQALRDMKLRESGAIPMLSATELRQRAARYDAVVASTSWRVTRPLRVLADLLGRAR